MRPLISNFLRPLVEWAGFYARGRFIKEAKKTYAVSNADRTQYRFHINQYDEFVDMMKNQGIPMGLIDITIKRMYTPKEVEYVVPDSWVPREDQPRVIRYMEEEGISKVVTLATGKGKTFCSSKAAETLGVLTCWQMGGRHMEKWIGDLMELFTLDKKEICVIRGSKALLNAINLSIAGEFEYKAILLSTTTMARFYKDYEAGKLRGYPIRPEDFWKVMGIGLRVVDEAHENQHQIFKMDLYAHLPKTIFLSATIETDSPFRNRMLQIQWPERMRFKPADFDRYIRVRALTYELWDVEKIRHINQQKMYSHTLFEESIMKRPLHLAHYLAMIDALVYDFYVKRREDGQRCLVFAATKDMCSNIADHLGKRNPTLEVARYISEDDYEVLMNSDIAVSTAGSAGTGVDIAGLRFSLMTTNVSSSQANIQIVGRLRKLKDWPDVEPEFMYILARNLAKHMEYHEKKKKLLRPRVKSIGEMTSTFVIGKPPR